MTAPTGGPAAPRVGRRTRLVDSAALLFIVSGAAVYLYAHVRMGELAAGRMPHQRMPKPGTDWNLAVWKDLVTTSRIGLVLAGTGVLVGVAGFVSHLLERRSALANAQADHS